MTFIRNARSRRTIINVLIFACFVGIMILSMGGSCHV